MGTRLLVRGLRIFDFRVKVALGILLCGLAALPLGAETFEGCSWAGPDLEWALDRILLPVDLVGSFGSREVIDLLHDSGAPISFISRVAKDPEVRFQRSEATTVRELLEEVMAKTPGYRFDVISGKLVIYPSDDGYDTLVEIGDPREAKRASALFSVLRELRSKNSVLRSLRLPGLTGPFGGIYSDMISVGGARTVIEHLVSLVAGSPSTAFWIHNRADGSMEFGLLWADVIEDLLLEAPKKVEVGKEFQVVPRVILVDGTPVTLIGPGCGVDYQSTDESILTIDSGGHALAIGKGRVGIVGKYDGKAAYVEVEVSDV